MKLDMVNFTIAQVRPYVQQHSVDYEKQKFKSLLELQKGALLSASEIREQFGVFQISQKGVDLTGLLGGGIKED